MNFRATHRVQSGYLMIEVLITLFILAIGLLGVVGLQARAEQAETDSYQRTQALILAQDMADRISANRTDAFDTTTSPYIVDPGLGATPLGFGTAKDCSGTLTTTSDIDLCAWQSALLGAGESTGGTCDTSVGTIGNHCAGTLLNARGCITSPAAHVYLIQVVWQGLTPSAGPPGSVACGATLYGANDDLRRAVTTIVQIPDVGAP